MAVNIHRHLNGPVAHLFFDVDGALSILKNSEAKVWRRSWKRARRTPAAFKRA